jgi:hypothetical protein
MPASTPGVDPPTAEAVDKPWDAYDAEPVTPTPKEAVANWAVPSANSDAAQHDTR